MTCSKNADALPIHSVTPFTMLDFPGRTACIIWFSGCNMRCHYCHNPAIVKSKGRYPVEKVLSFLEKRKGLLEGVVLSGGEAGLYRNIVLLARKIKSLGYAIKLDTNGSRPDIVQEMLDEDLLDYIALDYKAPESKYRSVTASGLFKSFDKTLAMLCRQGKTPFEVRTTVHRDLLDENDIAGIISDLSVRQYKGTYYIQNYINNDTPTLGNLPPQRKLLDISAFPSPQGFTLAFRNF